MSSSPVDASRARVGQRLGLRAALPAAALVVYAVISWLARVDLAVPVARSGELPAIVAEAARLARPSPVRATAEAPSRAVVPAREDRTGSREGQGTATAFQHAKRAGRAPGAAPPGDSCDR
jgi:hypothetical protein